MTTNGNTTNALLAQLLNQLSITSNHNLASNVSNGNGSGASSHLNNSVNSLSEFFNTCMYPSISVGDGHSIPVTNTGHSILPTPLKSLHLNNVLITPYIVKILISVRQFVRDNNCTIEFDAFGFFVKDFMTRRVLLRCDSTWDLYPVTAPSFIPHAFLVSQHTWHQRSGHPGGEVLRRLVSSNFISCNKEKPPVLCHACQLGKHVRLPFVSSSTYLADGTLSRYKARLVANGSTQLEGVVVDETFSSVVKSGTIRTVLSLAISWHWLIHQLDIKNSFLHGDISETVYMHQPLGFWDSVHHDYGTDTAYLLLYVDDIVLTASSESLLQQIISLLHQEFAMTDLGPLNYFLGIYVTRDSSSDTESKLGSDGDPVSDPTLYRSLAVDAAMRIGLVTLLLVDLLLGYCVFLGNNLLSWSSKRQPMLSHSSAEAEYRGVANVCDNVSVVYLSCNSVQHQRTKHIEIDIHFFHDLVAAGQVRVLRVPSYYQFTDIFTKGLPSALFEEFRTSLSVRCPPAPTAGEC
ncbi:ribonuclease H-like domain-containing protein [Tanacetum coccineum]